MRKPVVAGQFYSASSSRLKAEIEECFLDARGPGKLPEIGKKDGGLKGVVVPHAGYLYSGAIAAHSYQAIAENGFADTFVLIGPNHTGMGSGVSLFPTGEWETPFGKLPVEEAIVELLAGGIIDLDENAHRYEHSIEVQLPFLQYIAKKKTFSIVPICMAMQDYETSLDVGKALAEVIKQYKKRTVIIASSDFSHVGFNYHQTPPTSKRVDEYAKEQDTLAIKEILRLDPKGLIEKVYSNNISMCGYGCVAAMLVAATGLGADKATLLKYGTSYEVMPSSSCVGYGAVAVY
ncbi:MAG TPA: MEMO1 family protein [Thermoplasmatales archaeon]|nr:MEMO1 family protein [Thermoplasmatales archaeon]